MVPISPFSDAFRTFRLAAIHFLVLQVPQVIVELIGDLALPKNKEIWIGVLLLIPASIASTFSAAMTLVTVMQLRAGQTASLSFTTKAVLKRWVPLVISALLVGLLTALGIVAVVLPGIYLMAVYLFVPQLIVLEDRVPVSVSLHRSKKLVKRHLPTALLLVIGILALMLGTGYLQSALEDSLRTFSVTSKMVRPLPILCHVLISLAIGAFIDLLLSHYFLKFKSEPEEISHEARG